MHTGTQKKALMSEESLIIQSIPSSCFVSTSFVIHLKSPVVISEGIKYVSILKWSYPFNKSLLFGKESKFFCWKWGRIRNLTHGTKISPFSASATFFQWADDFLAFHPSIGQYCLSNRFLFCLLNLQKHRTTVFLNMEIEAKIWDYVLKLFGNN